MENRFNLIDEPWIPVADYGRVSLRQVFSNSEYRSLGGNPVQKIALFKLLLAIAQAAATPENEAEWKALGAQGLAERCLTYLDQWHDRFYLYGEQPFLQMQGIASLIDSRTKSKITSDTSNSKKTEADKSGYPKNFGSGFYPDLPSSNNTYLSHTMMEKELTDAEKAIFITTLMNFSFGGKRVEAGMISLGGSELGSRYSAPAGPSLGGKFGYLHCFVLAGSILNDLWINLLTKNDISILKRWPSGVGQAIWEAMPDHESDECSEEYKASYMSTLVSLSRFVLLKDSGIYYLDGIKYPKVSEGWYEPSLILDSNELKAKYADLSKKPWREVTARLSLTLGSSSKGFECFSLNKALDRCRDELPEFSIFIGGLRVSENSGDQSVKKDDDFVESSVRISSDALGSLMINKLDMEMKSLESLANTLWGRVVSYFKELKSDNGKKINTTHAGRMASEAATIFWHLCEKDFQELVDCCGQRDEHSQALQLCHSRFSGYVQQAYDQFCPRESARQLDAWAKCRPNNSKYLKQEI